jgi:nucleoside phosphorylase
MSHCRLRHEDYKVGWICALPYPELAASMFMLDGPLHEPLYCPGDPNSYTMGTICGHNVVLASLPMGQYGISSAANVATNMERSFKLEIRMMVGLAGGVPQPGHDIRLGDVVVSKPDGEYGGVVWYDHGKAEENGEFKRTGWLDAPPTQLLNAIGQVHARAMGPFGIPEFGQYLLAFQTDSGQKYARPDPKSDKLYDANDVNKEMERKNRADPNPVIHYGTIASGSSLIKDGALRDKLRKKHEMLCFEMEAAGLINNFRCIVIRGICDYADSHKNDQWQPYAAATAAAYAKLLLKIIPPFPASATGAAVSAMEG